MTIWAVFGWVAIAGSLAVLASLVAWLLMGRRRAEGLVDASWEFSPENYRLMSGLLAEEDLAFLRTQKGYRPEMGTRWRRERCDLFRSYLDELKADFRRLHAKARAMVAHSDAESAAFVGVLMRQEAAFLWALTGVEFRFFLYRCGVGTIKIAPFIELIEAMRLDLEARTAPQAA